MKLSAAIRIGSLTTAQIRGRMHDGKNGRCALGAAAEAAGMRFYLYGSGLTPGLFRMARVFPLLKRQVVYPLPYPFPEDLTPDGFDIAGAIWRLNDRHMWSRDLIADWIEGIENMLEKPEAKDENKITA